jgi:predicted  nucleic acid-binding Zn-ribbon protein
VTLQKVLDTLIDLQEIDIQIQRLEAEKGDLPQKVQSLSDAVDQTQQQLEDKKQQKKETLSEKLVLDNDVELLQTKLKKYKVQLYEVKTNKEYDAITLEIETSEQAIEEKGYKSLELEEAISVLDEEIKNITEKLSEQSNQLVESKKELEAKLEKTQVEEDAMRAKRASLAGELSRPVLASYDRIRQGRGGVAVSKLINGNCQECSSRVPPQRALEVRMMNKINLCEVCGRIVVWKPEYMEIPGDDLVQT